MKKTVTKSSARSASKGTKSTTGRAVRSVAAPSARNGKLKRADGQYLHRTRIDLPQELRSQICDILNETLANTLDLKTQAKQAHWNVKGVHFYQLHLLFDELAGELEEYVDLFAERITTLAGTAFGTVRMSAARTNLPDYPVEVFEGMEHVAVLADRYAQYAEMLRENIDVTDHLGDKDTSDIYTEVSRAIDMRLWFLEAHLQTGSAIKEIGRPRVAAKPKR